MKEIQFLPNSLLRQPSCQQVISLYVRSFDEVVRFDKADPDKSSVLDDFCATLKEIRNRHIEVVQTMAEGVLQMKEDRESELDAAAESNIPYFLDRFYMSRISIRMLINQHTLLFGHDGGFNPRRVGCFDEHCNVVQILREAAESASFLCERYYLASPEVEVTEQNDPFLRHNKDPDAKAPPIELVYVPSHLYHILFEVLKNAMRAVVEHHGDKSTDLPPLKVLITRGDEDLVIKISDRGGGVSRSVNERLFDYMFSTAPRPSAEVDEAAPLAGYGYGLPLSRLYARYLQGELYLVPYEGYGMDAIVFIKSLASEANEVLPIYSKSCEKHYANKSRQLDWSSILGSAGNGSKRSRGRR